MSSITHAEHCRLFRCDFPGCRRWKPRVTRLKTCDCSLKTLSKLLSDESSCFKCRNLMQVIFDHARSCRKANSCDLFMCDVIRLYELGQHVPEGSASQTAPAPAPHDAAHALLPRRKWSPKQRHRKNSPQTTQAVQRDPRRRPFLRRNLLSLGLQWLDFQPVRQPRQGEGATTAARSGGADDQ